MGYVCEMCIVVALGDHGDGIVCMLTCICVCVCSCACVVVAYVCVYMCVCLCVYLCACVVAMCIFVCVSMCVSDIRYLQCTEQVPAPMAKCQWNCLEDPLLKETLLLFLQSQCIAKKE